VYQKTDAFQFVGLDDFWSASLGEHPGLRYQVKPFEQAPPPTPKKRVFCGGAVCTHPLNSDKFSLQTVSKSGYSVEHFTVLGSFLS
jgi:hypothetical protein